MKLPREWKQNLRWLTVGIGLKRWLLLCLIGCAAIVVSLALALQQTPLLPAARDASSPTIWLIAVFLLTGGVLLCGIAFYQLSQAMLAPYRNERSQAVMDAVVEHSTRQKGLKLVAIGGGTGLPAALRGMKAYTSNITAIVTVADDGGSSGRLRRDLGVLPPGDLRSNIAALADDDSLLTRLFQYRFDTGDLAGHAFGNLFIAALANVVSQDENATSNSLAEAIVEVERVLNIQGRVLPSTLDDVRLMASVRLHSNNRIIKIHGESQIGDVDGSIDHIELSPPDAMAYEPAIAAILDADVIVMGPGSLYTSILPNLLVNGIVDALRATQAYKIYVCNVATQPVETDGYTVADHVLALEKHTGRGVFQAVLANNQFPLENQGITQYVQAAPANHEILQRYEIHYNDLTDPEKPWRHSPQKLAAAILKISKLDQNRLSFLKSASKSPVNQ